MSKVKESLEANMEFIRSQLPEDLKKHAESCLDNCEVVQDDTQMIKQTIIHELSDEIKATLDADAVLPATEPIPSLKEQKAAVLAELSEEFHADFEKNADKELAGS